MTESIFTAVVVPKFSTDASDPFAVSRREAHDLASQMHKLPIFIEHNLNTMQVGQVVRAEVDNGKLYAHFKMADSDAGKMTATAVERGLLNMCSLTSSKIRGGQARTTRIRAHELSLVACGKRPGSYVFRKTSPLFKTCGSVAETGAPQHQSTLISASAATTMTSPQIEALQKQLDALRQQSEAPPVESSVDALVAPVMQEQEAAQQQQEPTQNTMMDIARHVSECASPEMAAKIGQLLTAYAKETNDSQLAILDKARNLQEANTGHESKIAELTRQTQHYETQLQAHQQQNGQEAITNALQKGTEIKDQRGSKRQREEDMKEINGEYTSSTPQALLSQPSWIADLASAVKNSAQTDQQFHALSTSMRGANSVMQATPQPRAVMAQGSVVTSTPRSSHADMLARMVNTPGFVSGTQGMAFDSKRRRVVASSNERQGQHMDKWSE